MKCVGVYSAEAGAESKNSDSVHLWDLLLWLFAMRRLSRDGVTTIVQCAGSFRFEFRPGQCFRLNLALVSLLTCMSFVAV